MSARKNLHRRAIAKAAKILAKMTPEQIAALLKEQDKK